MGFNLTKTGVGAGLSLSGGVGRVLAERFWTPELLGSSLALWLDAADADTVILNGSNVSRWDDKSGNDRHAVQATESLQPSYGANTIGGLNVVDLDGDDTMLAPSFALSEVTVCAILKHTSENFILFGTNSTSNYIGVGESGSTNTNQVNNWLNPRFWFDGSEVSNLTRAQMYNVLDSSTRVVSITADGGNAIAVRPFGYPTAVFCPVGSIAEYVVVNTTVSTDDRQKLEGYLAWKWSGLL